MTPPPASKLHKALAETWPAARVIDVGPWQLREGLGGGQRVSSAYTKSAVSKDDLETAFDGMQSIGQPAVFMIRDGDDNLDAWLEQRGLTVSDPTALYVVSASDIARSYPITTIIPAWPPLAIQREIWTKNGIDDARIAVMERCPKPKTSMVMRINDTPAATVFLAQTGSITMLHALVVQPANRRLGVGEIALRAAAKWAVDQNADWLALAVTKANTPANALYQKLGMSSVAYYHYRHAPVGVK